MNLFAKFDSERTLTGICACVGTVSNFTLKVANGVYDNKINISGTLIEFDKFLKNLKSFTINSDGAILFKQGQSLSTLDDSKIDPDPNVPMAYTRANTVVNFGSL